MTTDLAQILHEKSIIPERLYRIELWSLSPVANAPEGDSPRFKLEATFRDLQDHPIEEIIDEISEFLENRPGRWRMKILYWKGLMVIPQTTKLMGRGQDFLHDYNKRGYTIGAYWRTIIVKKP